MNEMKINRIDDGDDDDDNSNKKNKTKRKNNKFKPINPCCYGEIINSTTQTDT